VIKKFIPLDMEHESDVVFQSALAAIKALKDDPLVGYPHGICTFSELSVPLVARLCNTLGLPSSSAEAVDIARNKHCTRAAMRDAGLATVANALIKSVDDVDESAAVVGFPAVLKPISGAASLGVKKVYNLEELRAAFVEVTAEMRDTVVSSGALVKTKTIDQDLAAVMQQEGAAVPLVKTKTIDQDLAAVMQQEGAAVPLVSEAKGPEREFVFMCAPCPPAARLAARVGRAR
jgi:carnosine synthase